MKNSAPFPDRRRNVTLFVCLITMAFGQAVPGKTPDFATFDELLLQNVHNGFVEYDGFATDDRFAAFVEQLGTSSPATIEGPDGGLAFYVNAYNALAIQGILNGQSPSSWWGRSKFFKRQKFRMLGEEITLEALEHERIAALGDPRIHFAIVCASLSCPRLSSRAYQSDLINVQLHDAANRFINDPTRNRFDLDRRIAFLSKIFDWYADDFSQAGGSVQRYLARFVDNAEIQEALRADEFELRYIEYDWNLNGHYSRAKE